MNLTQIKKEADKLLHTMVKVPLITEQSIVMIELNLLKNKIYKDKNIVLSYFKDSTYVVNSETLNQPYYSIVEETIPMVKE